MAKPLFLLFLLVEAEEQVAPLLHRGRVDLGRGQGCSVPISTRLQ